VTQPEGLTEDKRNKSNVADRGDICDRRIG
jgi:hypothetical protein